MQRKLRVLLDKALLLFVFASWLAGCNSANTNDPTSAPVDPIDAFAVRPISAQALRASMASSATQPRLFNFWATWCEPCLRELSVLQSFATISGWELVLVNLDAPSGRASRVDTYLNKYDIQSKTSFYLDTPDPSLLLPTILQPFNDIIPVTLMVDKQGVLLARFDGETTQAMLEEALTGAP
jgi:thiol-disulfide isomerase/thioredoxin